MQAEPLRQGWVERGKVTFLSDVGIASLQDILCSIVVHMQIKNHLYSITTHP